MKGRRTVRIVGAPYPTPWRRHLRALGRDALYRVAIGIGLFGALELLHALDVRGVL